MAEATPVSAAKQVVVVAGDSGSARLANELEQELKASSYVVIRVRKERPAPRAMLATLRDAHAWRGIVVSEDGKRAVVVAASGDGHSVRVDADYALDRDNRLARRRQWIALVERLRASAEEDENGEEAGEEASEMADRNSNPASAVGANVDDQPAGAAGAVMAKRPASTTSETTQRSARVDRSERMERGKRSDLDNQLTDSLGASVALGYTTGRTGLTSHLLLTGYHPLSTRISLAAHLLWPMVQSERSSDGLRSRVWTFSGDVGFMGDLGPTSWRAQPFTGATAGLQFLLAYVDRSDHAITDIYRVASLVFDAHLGVRILLRRETWLVVQASGGRAVSLATGSGAMTVSLANASSVRAAVGLLMAL